jgi:hypothetical protein
MSTTITYRVDIDGTIADPRFFDDDFQTCVDWYCSAGIVKQEEVASLTFHQQLFLLPQVLITHNPLEGAVEVLQELTSKGKTLQYFTVRQSFDPDVCTRVHHNTRTWLEICHFPHAIDVQFFWHAGDKLLKSLEAEEDQIVLIDDRPAGLAKAYEEIAAKDPQVAQQIRQRILLVAFGCTDPQLLPRIPGFRVIPLATWPAFDRVRVDLEKEFSYGSANSNH